MMKKNYFGKAMAVVVMLLAGLSFTSCDEKDNPLIINGKEWVKAEVTNQTEGGATIVANTPADVNRMLMKIASDLNTATQAGKDYVITIEAPSMESNESDNTISIPLYDYLTANPTSEAKVVVNFANAVNTSDEPLKIQAKGATGGAVAAENKVEINLPSSASGIDLELNMPKSTVTLNGGTIDELVATTANNTLIIESGVTVNWLLLNGGNAVVKDGGKVLGFLFNSHFYVSKAGISTSVYKNEVPENPSANDYYYVQKGKIIKGETNYPVSIQIEGSDEEQKTVPEIIISDGAYAWINNNIDPGNSNMGLSNAPLVNITGEGNATMMPWGADWGSGIGLWVPNRINLECVNKLTNVTIDYSKAIEFNYGAYDKFVEMGDNYVSEISLPINSENCTFKATRFHCSGNNISEDIVSSSHKDCTLDNLGSENTPLFIAHFPEQSDKRKTFNLAFDSCEFEQASFVTEYVGTTEYKDFKGYMVFDNSKIGGKAITKDNEMIFGDAHPENSATIYSIDGVDYNPVYDTKTDKWVLRAVAAE